MADAAMDYRDRSASELEREVDAERQRVSETIDALQRKVSVGSIVDEVVRTLGEHGGEASRNMALTLRGNPMAVLLTGVGLAWLMAGSGPRAGRAEWDEDYHRRSPDAGDPLARFDDPTTDGSLGDHSGRDDGPGLGERIGAAAGSVSEGVGAAGRELREGAASVGAGVSRLAGRAGDAMPAMGDVRHRLGRTGRSGVRGIEGFLEEQPLVVGALALALGAAVGSALPRTRTEDELFGAESDRLKQGLRATAEEGASRLGRSAAALADEAGAIASEATDELARVGSSAVERMDDAFEDASDRMRRAADEALAEDEPR